ncbi:MAG: hypothetical protein IKG83_10745 [Prevotella sp.]|nr:hypothetical protein [Prevotella sp.]
MREEIRAKCACFSDENCIFAKSVNQQKQERMMENVIETGAQKRMEVTEMSKTYLVSIAKWTNFLAILGIVCYVLMVVAGLFMTVASAIVGDQMSELSEAGIPATLLGGFYIVLAGLMIFVCAKALKAASALRRAAETDDSIQLENGLRNWRFVCRFMGWYTIIMLVVVLLSIMIVPALAIANA